MQVHLDSLETPQDETTSCKSICTRSKRRQRTTDRTIPVDLFARVRNAARDSGNHKLGTSTSLSKPTHRRPPLKAKTETFLHPQPSPFRRKLLQGFRNSQLRKQKKKSRAFRVILLSDPSSLEFRKREKSHGAVRLIEICLPMSDEATRRRFHLRSRPGRKHNCPSLADLFAGAEIIVHNYVEAAAKQKPMSRRPGSGDRTAKPTDRMQAERLTNLVNRFERYKIIIHRDFEAATRPRPRPRPRRMSSNRRIGDPQLN